MDNIKVVSSEGKSKLLYKTIQLTIQDPSVFYSVTQQRNQCQQVPIPLIEFVIGLDLHSSKQGQNRFVIIILKTNICKTIIVMIRQMQYTRSVKELGRMRSMIVFDKMTNGSVLELVNDLFRSRKHLKGIATPWKGVLLNQCHTKQFLGGRKRDLPTFDQIKYMESVIKDLIV